MLTVIKKQQGMFMRTSVLVAIIVAMMFVLWSCKKNSNNSDNNVKKPDVKPTNPVVREADANRVIIENPPIDSNAESVSLVVTRPQNSNAVGYRYALVGLPSKPSADSPEVPPEIETSPNVLSIILGNKDFIAKLMAEHGNKLMTEALQDPDITAKVKNIGMKIVTNQNILNRIMTADGIDTAELMQIMQDVLADVGKMEKAKTAKEKAKYRNSILAAFGKIQKNKMLSDVIIDAMLQESAFIAKLIREQGIISSILGKKEVIDSIMNAEGGEDLKALIDIPAVISNLDNILADMLEDSEFVQLVTEPATRAAIENLMSYSQQIEKERKKKKKNRAKIKDLNNKLNAEMLKLGTNTELISNVMGRLLLRVPDESNDDTGNDDGTGDDSGGDEIVDGVDPCEMAEYSEFIAIGRRLSVELGDFGRKILCIVGYDADGNSQQGASRYEWERTYAPSIYFSDDGLPKIESDVSSISVTVNASDKSLAGYRYMLMHNQSSCSLEFNDYSEVVKGFTTPITATLSDPGLMLLCVYGVDSANRIASVISFHSWYYRPAAAPPAKVPEEPGTPDAPDPAVDYSNGLMEARVLIAGNNYYYPGDEAIKNIQIKNTGKGALSWSLKVDSNHSWLQFNRGDDNWHSVRNASDAEKKLGFVREALAVGGAKTVSFRLAKGMALGMPYYREAKFSLINNATGFVSSFMVRLFVPRMLVSNSVLGFYSNNKSAKRILTIANSGSGSLLWDIAPLPNRSNWWNMKITRNNNSGTGTIEFSLNNSNLPTAKGGGVLVQNFVIFSNGDSQGVEECKSSVAANFDGSTRVRWPTADCHDFKIQYRY